MILMSTPSLLMAQSPQDHLVQSPGIATPERGSVSGQYAGTIFSPGQLSRGQHSMPSSLAVPEERGALGADIFPTYNPGAGLSEWGMGWSTSLSIYRARHKGHVSYDSGDHWMSPWGELQQGTDGAYYPVGMTSHVRLELVNDQFIVHFPNGTRAIYGSSASSQIDVGAHTYAYYISEVEDLHGGRTELHYTTDQSSAAPNPRLYLSEVFYGGNGQDFQYRIGFDYVDLTQELASFTSGEAISLRKQVSDVRVEVKEGSTFKPRWRYVLNYIQEHQSISFFLNTITRVYELSGQSEDLATFDYNLASTFWSQATVQANPKLNALIAQTDYNIVKPSSYVPLDINQDGLIDFEVSDGYHLLTQTASGFTKEVFSPLSPGDPGFHLPCVDNQSSPTPRRLSYFFGIDEEPHVLVSAQYLGFSSKVSVCKRNGFKVGEFIMDGTFDFNGFNHIRDIDGDHLPDLVRLHSGRIYVERNESTSQSVIMTPVQYNGQNSLPLGTVPNSADSMALEDMNGDGLIDILVRTHNTLRVWHGLGNMQFSYTPKTMTFPSFVGDLYNKNMLYIDANKDGLTDVVLSPRTGVPRPTLLVNQVSRFDEAFVPGLATASFGNTFPMLQDISGSGNFEVTFYSSLGASKYALNEAATGLMKSANDMKGTTLHFEYERAPAVEGVRQRQSVLSKLRHESKGYDTIEFDYDYEDPVMHSKNRQLLGYRFVSRSGPKEEHFAEFIVDDDLPPVLLNDVMSDTQVPDLQKVQSNRYKFATYEGVSWHMPVEQTSIIMSLRSSDVLESRETYNAYDGLCPTITKAHYNKSQVTTTVTLDEPSQLDNGIHCTSRDTKVEGNHTTNSSFDFRFITSVIRDSKGQPVQISVTDEDTAYTLQEVKYDGLGRPRTIVAYGKGTTQIYYNNLYLLDRIEAPTGVVLRSKTRPNDDLTVELITERPGSSYKEFFDYDDQERLERSWDNLGQSGSADPIHQYDYQYATDAVFAGVRSWRKTSNSGHRQHLMEFMTAGGEKLYSAIELGKSFKYSHLFEYKRSDGSTTRHKLQVASQHTSWGSGTGIFEPYVNLASARPIGHEEHSAFGQNISSWEEHHQNVVQHYSTAFELTGNALATTGTENGQYTKHNLADERGNVIRIDDELGVGFNYTYDALNRLRRAEFPDGTYQTATYDNYGRLLETYRANIGRQVYFYESDVMEHVTSVIVYDRQDTPRYRTTMSYDTIGRVVDNVRTQLDTGETAAYIYYYDGAHAEAPNQIIYDQLGYMTGVEGPSFYKRFTYREDQVLLTKEVKIPGVMTYMTAHDYQPDKTPRTITRQWFDPNGKLIQSNEVATEPDSYGFPSHIYLDGSYLARAYYGRAGLIRRVGFMDDPNQSVNNGDSLINTFIDQHYTSQAIAQQGYVWDRNHEVLFHYDTDTDKPLGLTQRWQGWESSALRRYNDRGSIDYDDFSFSITSSDRRHYAYDARNFLEAAWDNNEDWSYSYDSFGLIEEVMVNGVAENTTGIPGVVWQTDHSEHLFDQMGRLVYRQSDNDEMIFEYGATGHLERVEELQSGMEWTFLYDETGQRIAKFENGKQKRAYIDGVYFDLQHHDMLFKFEVGGQSMGVIYNSNLALFPMDSMGSIIGDEYGQDSLLSPYGGRNHNASSAQSLSHIEEAISFVNKGYDSDIRLIRMGVRDYSDEIRLFTTPDPLFLSEISLNISIYEANVFGYVKNNPVRNLDPTGTQVVSTGGNKFMECGSGVLCSISKSLMSMPVPIAAAMTVSARSTSAIALYASQMLTPEAAAATALGLGAVTAATLSVSSTQLSAAESYALGNQAVELWAFAFQNTDKIAGISKANMIRSLGLPKKNTPRIIVAAVDPFTGEVVIGGSGRVQDLDNLNPQLRTHLERVFGPGNINTKINSLCENMIGACAEINASDKLLNKNPKLQIKDIKFSKPLEPKTGKIKIGCKNCQEVFGKNQISWPPEAR